MNTPPFGVAAKGMSVAATSTASSSAALPNSGPVIRVVNEGPNIAFVSVGSTAQTATLPTTSSFVGTCTAVLPSTDVTFSLPADYTTGTATPLNISAICRAAGTATLSVYVGDGI